MTLGELLTGSHSPAAHRRVIIDEFLLFVTTRPVVPIHRRPFRRIEPDEPLSALLDQFDFPVEENPNRSD